MDRAVISRQPRPLRALLAGLLALVLSAGAAHAASSSNAMAPIRAGHFPEPLVAAGPTTAAEDDALAQAAAAYAHRAKPDDFESLTGFVAAYPHSAWAPAVLTNLGILYLHYGYFSRALDAWHQAWEAGRNAAGPRAEALVDGAVGDLARLDAALGRNQELAALFGEIGKRPITGSATEAVAAAAEELALSRKPDHGHLFICGPMALRALLLAEGTGRQQVEFLRWYRAGANGTNLAELARLAAQAKFPYRLVFRTPGQAVPLPAIVHWKLGHFAAVVGKVDGRYRVEDPVFPGRMLWVTQRAFDAEASGYFLVPAGVPQAAGWRSVPASEAARVWGKGPTFGTEPGAAGLSRDPQANPVCPGSGMCGYNIGESTISLTLVDNPVGYTPPLGPPPKVQIVYNQREDSQPQVFGFFNIGPKWTLNWLSYVTDDPDNPGGSVTRYLPGGGAYYYTGYNSLTGQFAAQNNDGSILVLAAADPVTYRRQLADGGVEIYAQSDGAASYPRNIFLSQIIDPQGNTLTLNYDGAMRLASLTDAVGRQTTFGYGLPANPLLVTQITDPFGRSANLTYDASGRLSAITDVLGLTSSFGYDANSLVDAMTTPYGTTNFAYTAPGASAPPRFVQVTDPLGYNEREEWVEGTANNGIPDSDPPATVPAGMPLTPYNSYLSYRDSFHWDKNAYIAAGCGSGPPPAGCNYAAARDRHFNHDSSNINLKSTSIESVKYPLENRVWYQYPGQTTAYFSGSYEKPNAIGRVLDDGTTQRNEFSYDTANYFALTQVVDAVGRTTSFTYAPNAIDLTQIAQTVAGGSQATIAQFAYSGPNCTVPHRVCTYTDAAGETTAYAYNAAGQLTAITNPLNQTTSFQYGAAGDLTTIVNADNQTAASFTYDGFDRIRTYTDAAGWTATCDYDAADRITRITYPDGSTDRYTWDRLDLAAYQDRLGRAWRYAHDADRRLTQVTDPLGELTQFGYDDDGRPTSLTDPKNNRTQWAYDVEGRVTAKTYPDNSTLAYTYENTTSRLYSVLDALGQTKQYGYAADNRPTGITYQNAVNPTANVGFAWDPYFPRLVLMTDGTGTTTYAYVPVASLGALRLQQETPPLAGSAIAYAYDALGRLASRTVAGAGAESFGYDAIGRLTSHANDLGAFTLAYLGETGQITGRTLAGSTVATAWSYLPNSGDRRLAGIANTGLTSGQYTNFSFTSMPEALISGVTQASDAAPAYPPTGTRTASYNKLNQLTNLSGQALSWDVDGNLLSDGTRNYSWDAENRLIAITYPGQPGTQTSFAYDGLGRRTATTGVSGTTTSYLWCGSRLCQARDASGAVTREYFAEGEYVPGSPAQPYYYGVDQLGSVRRVFASTASAPAYDYDADGEPLQTTAPVTDFTYAGMFYNTDSGLDLATRRAYDPVAGRWLSRDPLGEMTDPVGNLYRYVGGNPVNFTDPQGLLTLTLGLSYSAYAGTGGEVGYGLAVSFPVPYFDPNASLDIGSYIYSGGGAGANVGSSFNIGIYQGDLTSGGLPGSNISSTAGVGPFGVGGSLNPTTGQFVGGTFSYGPRAPVPIFGSTAITSTAVSSLRNALMGVINAARCLF